MSQPSITNCPFTFGFSVYGWYIRSVYRFHYRLFFTFLHHVCLIQVTIALRFHLFPFRTEKLSSVTPMVLRNSGRVGSRRFQREALVSEDAGAFLFWGYFVCLALYLPCFACFLGVSRFLVGIILILVKCFFFLSQFLGYYIVSSKRMLSLLNPPQYREFTVQPEQHPELHPPLFTFFCSSV